MNYSYKKFLAKAKEVLKDTLEKSEKILNSIGMTMEFDASFPWTGEFKEAVGRCGIYSENADFAISIHFRAIYQTIQEDMFDAVDTEYEWERQTIDGIEGTVFHEIAHGILHKIMDYCQLPIVQSLLACDSPVVYALHFDLQLPPFVALRREVTSRDG